MSAKSTGRCGLCNIYKAMPYGQVIQTSETGDIESSQTNRVPRRSEQYQLQPCLFDRGGRRGLRAGS